MTPHARPAPRRRGAPGVAASMAPSPRPSRCAAPPARRAPGPRAVGLARPRCSSPRSAASCGSGTSAGRTSWSSTRRTTSSRPGRCSCSASSRATGCWTRPSSRTRLHRRHTGRLRRRTATSSCIRPSASGSSASASSCSGSTTPSAGGSRSRVMGTLSILMIGRAPAGCSARRCSAPSPPLLLAFEGHHFVHSRTGAARPHPHVLGARGVLLPAHRPRPVARDPRPQGRRAADAGARRARPAATARGWAGVRGGWPPGVCLGLAGGTKWSGPVLPGRLRADDGPAGTWARAAPPASARWRPAAVAKDGLYAARGDGRRHRRRLPTSARGPAGSTPRRLRPHTGPHTHPSTPLRLGAGLVALAVALPPRDVPVPHHACTSPPVQDQPVVAG